MVLGLFKEKCRTKMFGLSNTLSLWGIALSLVGCSLISSTKAPHWLRDTGAYCSVEKLCATGEGEDYEVASLSARKGISDVLESQVEAHTSLLQSAGSDGVEQEDLYSSVEQVSREIISGVQIVKRHKLGHKKIAVLAELDRAYASDFLKRKMEMIDEEVAVLYNGGRRGQLAKGIRLLLAREQLDARYRLLQGKFFKAPVTLAQVRAKKSKKEAAKTVVLLTFKGKRDRGFERVINSILLDNGDKVVMSPDSAYKFKLQASLSTEKLYLNVKGFERYRFTVRVISYNKLGQALGEINFSSERTARSEKSAYEMAFEDIVEYLQEHMEELNMS